MRRLFKRFTFIIIACAAVYTLSSCGESQAAIDNTPLAPVTGESKILVAYFSWSGNTQQVADSIAKQTGGERFRIVPEEAYTNDDVFDRAQAELRDEIRPPLAEHIDESIMAQYDVIFLGFPIWWYDLPMPVWTFLEEYDLSGKTIFPFFTHNGSSSGANSILTVKMLCPHSSVSDNYLSIRGSSAGTAENEVKNWINELGIKREESQ